MHGNSSDRRALEREALRNVINQWNANRLDLFELSEPNEDLEFHGVMRFYFQDSGQKVATKCIRVASDATVEDVIGTLVEKFRPDMRMLSVPSYALYELHEGCSERRMATDEKPLLVQLNWHVDDREGRFLLKNIDDKTVNSVGSIDSNASFRRKLSKREKKQLKKQEKLSRMKSENGDINDKDGVAEKLYTELPETLFTRSISNPEAVMRRRRQQKLEKKLQQFRSKDGGPDTGGTLKIYGEALCKDVPYKTLLLSIRDCAGAVVKEMLDKYGLTKTDPSQWCLVQVTTQPHPGPDLEYVLDDDECPLSILMNATNTGSIMFHVRRRPADCAPRKRKKKPGALGGNANNTRDVRGSDSVPLLVELGPDGSTPHPVDTARTIRLANDVMEVGSANGIALQLYGPHIQPRHCVIINTDGVTSLKPCHADALIYVNGQRIHQTTILTHGNLVKFGHSNTYRFLDLSQEDRTRHPASNMDNNSRIYDRSPRALSPTEPNRENIVETTFDLEGNVETISTASGPREDNRSLGSSSENRLSGMDRYPRGQDPILPAVLEFPEEPQEQFLARVITHLDVTTPTFRLAPAYTLYLCARYRASTHYRPELTPTERAHKLTLLLQHAAMLIRHTVQDRSTESTSQAFWLANASELLHFLKSDRHVSAFSLQAQDTLADAVQLAFKNLVACLTDELNSAMSYLMSVTGDDHPREIINILSGAMILLRKCRVNAALTIQLFSQLFHWISAKALSNIISNSNLCSRSFGNKLFNRLRNLQAWAESQGLELAAECHLAKIVQCAQLLQAPKFAPEELASLSAACFKLNSMQLGALLMQYKAEPGEKLASQSLLEQAAKAAESVADELARAEGREVTLYEDPAPPLQLLLPDDGFSCDVVQGVPPGLADFLHPLQASGLCRLAAQPTSSGHWTVYMSAPRPPSSLSTTQPEVQVIRLHKAGGGMGLSIVAAKGTGQERLGIYIKSVVPGGAADRDGRLAAGDQLLSVDGQSLLGITQEKAAEFLVRTGSVVTLEVAKGGAVYHGLATALLQQPSPTPHRAMDPYYYYDQGSQESLYSINSYHLFTPPATKPKNNVFFSSDDNLYMSEKKKLTIPRIEIDCDPVFSLQVTDFTDPCPKNVILSYDESGTSFKLDSVEELPTEDKSKKSWKDRANNFVQQKSYSIEVHENPYIDIDEVSDTDKFLSIGSRKFRQNRLASTSLQDLSSSTSSINSGFHDSNLDLSQIDPDTPVKHWKSPDEIRHGNFNKSFTKQVDKAISVPDLAQKKHVYIRSKSVSEENLNDKLTEYERLEILKLLHDWSLNGSESKSDFTLKIVNKKSNNRFDDHFEKDTEECSEKSNLKNCGLKFKSEPNLSPKKSEPKDLIIITKYSSENNVNSNKLSDSDFLHKCEFRNCIFNVDFVPKEEEGTNINVQDLKAIDKPIERRIVVEKKPKGILKNSKEKLNEPECLNNITNLQQTRIHKLDKSSRRFSEVIETNKSFNSQLVRCDSLERLTDLHKNYKNKQTITEFKKFPDSYIVTRKNSTNSRSKLKNNENSNKAPKSPKVIMLRKKYLPKAWKSCSDIKTRPKPVRKCCKFAKKSCPVLKNSSEEPRKTQSCVNIEEDVAEQHSARLAALQDLLQLGAFNRPRRMSERDLPSRVDAERTIPSSKSVPALHHISPNSEQPRVGTTGSASQHDVFNPGYSRTSSNNSINTNSTPVVGPQNNGPIAGNPAAASMRSRSTHNLHQQDNGGFYQNLSVYRNKVPSPQHLGDRTSALRSSQNSLQSSIANSQRPSSAYYPPPAAPSGPQRPTNLHQSIPNLKSAPSTHRLHNDENRSTSYPAVNQQYNQQNNYPPNNSYSAQNSPYGGSQQAYPASNNYHMSPTRHEDINNRFNSPYAGQNNSFPSPTHNSTPTYPNSNLQQPLHIHANGQRQDERIDSGRYSTINAGGGLLREDVFRQSQGTRHEEMMRYPSTNNVRISEAQIQNSRIDPTDYRHVTTEMRNSKSDDVIKQHTMNHQNDMLRYASSGNIRAHDSTKIELSQLRQTADHIVGQHRLSNDQVQLNNNLRGQAKMAEMSEEVRRRQNRLISPSYQQPGYQQQPPPQSGYYQQQHQPHYSGGQQHGNYPNNNHPQNYNMQLSQNTQSMQNLTLSSQYQNQQSHNPLSPNYPYGYPLTGSQANTPTSPTYKSPPVAPKPTKKEEVPELPPTSTHPLYSASLHDPPKMAFYPTSTMPNLKTPRDPWAREEQERQAEVRREVARQWQEQQIRELGALPHRTQQQEEQLRVLQLEREFQRRALEASELDDEDTEKESPSPHMPQPVSSQSIVTTSIAPTVATSRMENSVSAPTSILKAGANTQSSINMSNNVSSQQQTINNHQQQSNQPSPTEQQHIAAPPPPERGSSFAVMSMRVKESTKRVSFNDVSANSPQPPTSLHIDETIREDPNSFIRQAESMLASPTTPTGQSPGMQTATPGVIGAQEVYRDPRTRRLAEQAQQKNLTTPVPEKLSFKEKMKMFAMETGEQETPKDKSKISRAQREIDNLGSPSSGLVH